MEGPDESETVYRFSMMRPDGVDQCDVPALLRQVADVLESSSYQGFEVDDLSFVRWPVGDDVGVDGEFDEAVMVSVYLKPRK